MRAMATCHPDRPSMGRGLCCACYQRQRKAMIRELGPRQRFRSTIDWTYETGGKPPRISGVTQYAVTVVPEACPKCGGLTLDVSGREIWCRGARGGCGATLYLVRDETIPVGDALTHPRAGLIP